jgi:hypothetical protein
MVNGRAIPAAPLMALLVFLAAFPACGQEGNPGGEPPRRLLLLFEAAPSARLDAVQRLLLYESLLVKLGRASERIAVVEYGEPASPPTDQARLDAAESRRADAWILVTVDGRWPQLELSARAFDLLAGSAAFELSLGRTVRRGAVDLERHFWDEIVEAVRSTLPGSGRRVARSVSRETLALQGVPGTRVRGFGGKAMRLGDGGALSIETLLPATFSFRATRLGYKPVERDIYLEPGLGTLDLGQERGSRWACSLYLQMMNYPGFEVSYYPIPDFLWVKLGFTSYLLGFVLAMEEEQSMLVSFPLSHLNLSAGIYLRAADRLFRPYLGLGAFARLITARAIVFALEPIAPWGLQPVLGMEISRNLKRRFYFEYAPFFYLPTDPSLFRLSIPRESGPPILPIPAQNPQVFWDTAVFRFGLRWLL